MVKLDLTGEKIEAAPISKRWQQNAANTLVVVHQVFSKRYIVDTQLSSKGLSFPSKSDACYGGGSKRVVVFILSVV